MRREPLLTRAAVAAAVSAVLSLLSAFDVALPATEAQITDAIYHVLILVAWAWAVYSARKRVTPVDGVKAPPVE
jgi:hypothetical protein